MTSKTSFIGLSIELTAVRHDVLLQRFREEMKSIKSVFLGIAVIHSFLIFVNCCHSSDHSAALIGLVAYQQEADKKELLAELQRLIQENRKHDDKIKKYEEELIDLRNQSQNNPPQGTVIPEAHTCIISTWNSDRLTWI